MNHLTLILADLTILADRDLDAGGPNDAGLWDVRLMDTFKGTFQRIFLTDAQLAAMVGLGIGAEQDEPLIEALRGVALPEDLDPSLAPMP